MYLVGPCLLRIPLPRHRIWRRPVVWQELLLFSSASRTDIRKEMKSEWRSLWLGAVSGEKPTKMCLTLIDWAAFSLPLPPAVASSSLPFPLPLPAAEPDLPESLFLGAIPVAMCLRRCNASSSGVVHSEK